jgi:hypothetical protein
MQLCAVLTRDELAHVIEEIAPLDVELSRRPRRILSLTRPELVELVEGSGLRVRGSARLTWDVAGVSVPVTIRACQVLLAPAVEIRDGAYVLAFEPRIEHLDITNVPGFVEEAVTGALEGTLAAKRDKLTWPFGRHLALRRMLPERISPATRFDLVPAGGEVVVGAAELRLTIDLEAHVRRGAIGIGDTRRSA